MGNREIGKRVKKKAMRKRNPLTGSKQQSHDCQVDISAACAPLAVSGLTARN